MRYDLVILREEAAIRHVHQLQHFGIVVQLHGHGMHVLSAGNQQIHCKCVALCGLYGWRIEQEAGSAAGRVRSGLACRGLVGLRLDRRIGRLRGVCAGAALPAGTACGLLTWRNSIVFAVPISIARWLISFTSVPRMTCGVMAKTVSSEEWSVVVWPKRYFKIGIWANPGMPLERPGLRIVENAANQA